MKFTLTAVAAAAIIAATTTTLDVAASPTPSNFVVKDGIHVPSDWIRRDAAPAEQLLNLRISLAKRDQQGLEARLLEISQPGHPDYGQWLSRDQVSAFTEPSLESRNAVARWLQSHGVQDEHISKRSFSGNDISVTVPVQVARAMLGDADLAIFEHRDSGEQRLTTSSYSLPREVADHVETIGGLAYFGRTAAQRAPFKQVPDVFDGAAVKIADVDANKHAEAATDAANGVPASCKFNAVTAQCLRELYGTYDYKPSGKGQFIGVSGYLDQYATFSDLALYEKDQRTDAVGYNFSVVSISNGQNVQSQPGLEANLDVQTVAGVAYPIKYTFYTTGGEPPYIPDKETPTNTNEPYLDQLNYLLGLKSVPSILTTSYDDSEQSVPYNYAKKVCGDLAALTARGTSLFFSSGDYGVGTNGTCYTNDGKSKPQFLPMFPCTCPWVTSVGATQNFAPEIAAIAEESFITSGAGFSNYFTRPAYQSAAVSGYLNKIGNLHKGLYNPKGRAYPDVAAQGSRYKIYINGSATAVSGTSASAPLFASITALLNDVRIKAGNKNSKLGFLNPWIYGLNGYGFTDITEGASYGCNTSGFPAKKGWDAVTGWGTPQFQKLEKVIWTA